MGQILEAEVVVERERLSFSKSATDQERVRGVKSLTNRGRNKGLTGEEKKEGEKNSAGMLGEER